MQKFLVAIFIVCCTSICFAQFQAGQDTWQILREWKSKDDEQTTKARFVGDIDDFCVFLSEDGKLAKVKTDTLSNTNISWIQDTRHEALLTQVRQSVPFWNNFEKNLWSLW